MPRASTRPRPPVKESDILRGVKEYLAWERIWVMRVHCGRARHGGTFTNGMILPNSVFPDDDPKVLNSKQILQAAKKGTVRRNEQWIEMAPAGTPDLMLMLPANRPVFSVWSGEMEQAPFARIGWIETKAPGGRLRNEEQREFKKLCEKQNALWWLVDDLDELRRYIPPRFTLV